MFKKALVDIGRDKIMRYLSKSHFSTAAFRLFFIFLVANCKGVKFKKQNVLFHFLFPVHNATSKMVLKKRSTTTNVRGVTKKGAHILGGGQFGEKRIAKKLTQIFEILCEALYHLI